MNSSALLIIFFVSAFLTFAIYSCAKEQNTPVSDRTKSLFNAMTASSSSQSLISYSSLSSKQ